MLKFGKQVYVGNSLGLP